MADLIDRNSTIDSIEKHLRSVDELYPLTETDRIMNHAFEIAASCVYNLPSAHPELDEWCTDCKEYDQERHCCPRWNRVIRKTLKDAQPEPRWIPCEEALPKENGFYEVTVGAPYKPVRIYEYNPCDWYENKNMWKAEDGCYVFNWFVKAWRECPKPYERSEE